MRFWANFARSGEPGFSSNNIEWVNYLEKGKKNFIILDKKKNLSINQISNSFYSLVKSLR